MANHEACGRLGGVGGCGGPAVEALEERALMSGVPVLIVPGTMGSLPGEDTVRLWLQNDPAGTAPRAMEREYLTDSYDPIIDAFEQQDYSPGVHYRLGETLFFATYDWRRPVGLHEANAEGYPVTDANADGLPDTDVADIDCGVEYLEYWIARAKALTGADKVDIVAHSMGGLVAREYVQSDYYAGDVDKLVLLGTPNHGSAAAAEMWEFGDAYDNTQDYFRGIFEEAWDVYRGDWHNVARMPEGLSDFTSFLQAYVPGLRDLLPTYDYEYLDGVLLANDPPANPWLAALNAEEGLAKYAARGVDVTIVGGRDSDTPGTLVLEDDGDGVDHYHEVDGDGTVPFDFHNGLPGPMSVFLPGLPNNAADRLDCSHVELTSDPDAVDTVMAALNLPALDGDYDQGTASWLTTWWRAEGWWNSDSLASLARETIETHPQSIFFHAGSPASFYDADGDKVTLSLWGPGEGELRFSRAAKLGDELDASDLLLTGTSADSRLTLSVRHSDATSLASISVDGSLAALNAPTLRLTGSLAVNGSLVSLALGNCLAGPTISVAASAGPASYSFGRVADVTLDSPAPLASLSAAQWIDTDASGETVTAPWIDRLSVRGDFDADLILTGAGALAGQLLLGSASVTGIADGDLWDIPGSAGPIALGALSADIDIEGDCRSFKVGGYLALLPPPAGSVGSLRVGGASAVTSAAGKMALSNGTLYVSTSAPYSLQSLRLLPTPGATGIYAADYGTPRRPAPAVTTVAVDATPQTLFGADYLAAATTITPAGSSPAYFSNALWRFDALGSYLGAWSSISALGSFTAGLSAPLTTPPLLQQGRRYSSTKTFTGPASFSIDSNPVSGTFSGTASLAAQFLGHETVTVAAGTYLTARFSTDLTLTGTIPIIHDGRLLLARLTAREKHTHWSAPAVGIVKSLQTVTLTLAVPGHGTRTLNLSGTLGLTGFSI